MAPTLVKVPDGVYTILNPSNLFLNADPLVKTQEVTGRGVKTDAGFLQQYFWITKVGEHYKIANIRTGEFLYLPKHNDETPLTTVREVNNDLKGLWRIVKKEGAGPGKIAFQNAGAYKGHENSGYIDLKDASAKEGTVIQGYQSHQSVAQDWIIKLHSINAAGVVEVAANEKALKEAKILNLLPGTTYLQIPGEMYEAISKEFADSLIQETKRGIFDADAQAIAYKNVCNKWALQNIRTEGLTVFLGIAFNTDPASADFGYWILLSEFKGVEWVNTGDYRAEGIVNVTFNSTIY